MFRLINKLMDRFSGAARSNSGQAAVVLVLVIAFVMIYYAASINFGALSRVKASVQVASNTSAGILASNMASYGTRFSQTQLRGELEVCKLSGFFGALIGIGLTIAGLFIAPLMHIAIKVWVSVLAVSLSVGAAVLQLTVLDPNVTSDWNRKAAELLSTDDQFIESAIQSALSKVVADPVRVPDVTDMDNDRVWVVDPTALPWADTVSRYEAYYDHRMEQINMGVADEILDFIDALEEFLYDGTDGWGIHDHLGTANCFGTAECNPCCMPSSYVDPVSGSIVSTSIPPSCTAAGMNDAAREPLCDEASLYGIPDPPLALGYSWTYEPAYEDPFNNFYSFREMIGRDDEHKDYQKPDASTPPLWDPNQVPQSLMAGFSDFYMEDATGYYVPPNFGPDVPETRRGIYPFFWKISDWGMDLSKAGLDFAANPRECYWCDILGLSAPGMPCQDCTTYTGVSYPHPHPPDLTPQLTLPYDPLGPPYTINPPPLPGLIPYNYPFVVNLSYIVDGVDNRFGLEVGANNALAVDKIVRPDQASMVAPILADDNQCAGDALYPVPSLVKGFFKPGNDRFCANTWPYGTNCAKHNAAGCPSPDGCDCFDAADPTEWPEDPIDGLYEGLGDFVQWAENFLVAAKADPLAFATDLPLWYPDAARWIEPSVGNCFLCSTSTPLADPPDGYLHVFLQEILAIQTRILTWTKRTSFEDTSGSCSEVWCTAPAACLQWDEETTSDANANGFRGDMEDVAACLNHNTTAWGGNAARFKLCYDYCLACQQLGLAFCTADVNTACGAGIPFVDLPLPRSLVPGFDPNAEFIPVDPGIDPGACGPITAPGDPIPPGSFLDKIAQSIPEAEQQVAKFQHRLRFLQDRLAEANAIETMLSVAANKFQNFVSGPADDLIRARIAFDPNAIGLPRQAVYGWLDPSPDGINPGQWHVVKVEARIPGNCDGACARDQVNIDPDWPRIIARKKAWGTKRCFKLENTEGSVKFRTIRYDEEETSSSVTFPGGRPLWTWRTAHPERPQIFDPWDLADGRCDTSTITTFRDGTNTGGIYDGAFIMNAFEAGVNDGCWNTATQLLSTGVVDDTCAEYFWDTSGPTERMNFKFVQCQEF